MVSEIKKELELFLASDRELDAQFARGDAVRVDYLITKSHIRKVLYERCPLGCEALCQAEIVLLNWRRASTENLRNKDYLRFRTWQDELTHLNRERLALKMLEGLEGIETPPIPAPRPNKLGRLEVCLGDPHPKDWPATEREMTLISGEGLDDHPDALLLTDGATEESRDRLERQKTFQQIASRSTRSPALIIDELNYGRRHAKTPCF